MLIVTTLAKFEAFTQFFWGKNFYLQTKLFLFLFMYCICCRRTFKICETRIYVKLFKQLYIYRTCNSVL